MAIDQHEGEQKEDGDVYDSSSGDDESNSSGSSSTDPGSSRSGSSSSSDDSDDDSSDPEDENEKFEIGFWESLKAALPWTQIGKDVRESTTYLLLLPAALGGSTREKRSPSYSTYGGVPDQRAIYSNYSYAVEQITIDSPMTE